MNETIGKQLKEVRESKNLTIQQVVQATRIRAHLIEAIEADDFTLLPSEIQVHAFIKLYADFLGLSLEEIIARQRAEVDKDQPALVDSSDLPSGKFAGTRKAIPASFTKLILKITRVFRALLSRIKHLLDNLRTLKIHLPKNREKAQPDDLEQINKTPVLPISDNNSLEQETSSYQVIINNIGEELRRRREILSLSMDEIENHTHINIHYLTALENGEFEKLPSSVQARGMLNNFALFLNLDADELLLDFADALQLQRKERALSTEQETHKPKRGVHERAKGKFHLKVSTNIRQFLSLDTIVGVGFILLLLMFAFWGTSRINDLRANSTPQPTPLSFSNLIISNLEETTVTPTALSLTETLNSTFIPVEESTLAITFPAGSISPVQVVVIAQDQAWVRVTVDGIIQFEGRVTPGTAYPYNGNTQIEVLTGNGLAVEIIYNQNNLGPMGNFGEVIDRIYTANVVLLPTATNTPTPTVTPTPTITIPPTATLRPSATPRYNPTSVPGQ